MLKGLFVLREKEFLKIYGPEEIAEIEQLVDIYAPLQTRESIQEDPSILAEADVIFSGWGMAVLDERVLAAAPNLKAVFYAAGTIKYFVTDAFWERGIAVTSAYSVNAIPTAELALSHILFSLKRGWEHVRTVRREKRWMTRLDVPGAYGSTVGIITLGMIGQKVVELLQPFDVNVIVYSTSEEKAARLGLERCALDELFRRADVVSLHTPWLPQTEGMITGEHLSLMKKGATFINTARGAIVREDEMIDVLRERPDLFAVLDVTYPEPPEDGSPLYTLPNVVLTPHIGGAMGNECRRMSRLMIEELKRYLAGEPLQWQITQEQADRLA